MKFVSQDNFRNAGSTVQSGAQLGILLTLLYSAIFAIYAIVRSSLQIGKTLALNEGLLGTLVVNAFALLLPILIFALILGVGAFILQSLVLLLVYGVRSLINEHHSPLFMAGIGLINATILVALIQVAVQQTLGNYFAALWPSGYLFWLGLPSLLFVGATTWVCWRFGGKR